MMDRNDKEMAIQLKQWVRNERILRIIDNLISVSIIKDVKSN